jgi:phage terminase small subunit
VTPKQEQFCREYLIDLNATQAAIRAGYSAKTAGQTANENLKKPQIQARVAELQNERQERTDITADRVLEALATIAFMDPRRVYRPDGQINPTEIPDDLAKAVAGIEPGQYGTKIKFNDRLKALELIGRHLAMFTDKVETKITEGQVTIFLPDNGRGNKDASDRNDSPDK